MSLLYCRIVEPLVHGDYPIIMKENAGARIPAFTNHESEQIKGSYDFIGVIHYNNVNISDNSDVLNKELQVMDSTAISMCMENHIRLVVFNMNEPNNIVRAATGEDLGTIIE